jgi:ribonuclease HI
MVEYEALLFGFWKARTMVIKLLKVEGDSELIVNQVRMKCEAQNQGLKGIDTQFGMILSILMHLTFLTLI